MRTATGWGELGSGDDGGLLGPLAGEAGSSPREIIRGAVTLEGVVGGRVGQGGSDH